MNYKIIQYRCGCKYVLITDPDKRIFKAGKCPEHWKNQESITLWCVDCGVELSVTPQAGHRQKRCYPCGKLHTFGVNKENWRTKYAGRYKQNGENQYKEPESLKAKRIINEMFEKIGRKYKPVWEGI